VLVVSEVALATILLVAAGLLVRSLQQMLAVDPGFQSERVLTTHLTLSAGQYPDGSSRAAFFQRLMEELSAQPGVVSAAAVNSLPMSGFRTDWYLVAEGHESSDPTSGFIQFRCVTPDYFETLGIPLLRGRAFTDRDTSGSQPVAIVSESVARTFWGDQDPIGRRVRPGGWESSDPWHVVVGVVGDVYHSGARRGAVPIWYRSAYQLVWNSMSLAVRSAGDPSLAREAIRDSLARIDPHQPIYETKVMSAVVGQSLSQERLSTGLLLCFAGLAFTLASVGVYGVVAYSVSQRTREIGVRMALGAPRARVVREVLAQGLGLLLPGLGIGLGTAFALGRVLHGFVFGVAAHDPATFVGVGLAVAVIGLASCLLPARRASQVDPLVALRHE
jgi:putative ABC transport system permease protein